MCETSVYKFKYVPAGDQPVVVRYIDLSQVIAIGLFVDRSIIGIQIDCKLRDAPLVIEVVVEPHLIVSETDKLKIEMDRLVSVWTSFVKARK